MNQAAQGRVGTPWLVCRDRLQGAFNAGRHHAGPRIGLLCFVAGLCLRLRQALRENGYDLRLRTRWHRFRRAAVLPDLRIATA